MADEIIEELWSVKDGIARQCGYDADVLVARLTSQVQSASQCVVGLAAAPKAPGLTT